MVRAGSIGVALSLLGVEFVPRSGAGASPAAETFGDEVALATVQAKFRFVVDEVTRTFPSPCLPFPYLTFP
jgi:hypothetical protein